MQTIKVKVKPNSKKTELIKIKDNIYYINLKAPPENNKANIELIKKLSKALKCQVRILSGQTSKHKRLEIAINDEEWKTFLSAQ